MRTTLALFLAGLFATACGGVSEEARSNVVLIVVDTLRADHALSSGGLASTPAIDALAADGVRFESAFSHAPLTLPAHTSLFSSRHPWESGVKINAQLVQRVPLLSEWLLRAGYRTAAVVSLSSLWPYESGAAEPPYQLDNSLRRGFETYVYDGNVDCWPGDRVAGELERLLDTLEGSDDPFFLFAHFQDPHDPYDAHGTVRREVEVLLDGVPLQTIDSSGFGFRTDLVNLRPGQHTLDFRGAEPFVVRVLEARTPTGLLLPRWELGHYWRESRAARAVVENETDGDLACELWMMVGDALDEAETRERYRLEAEYGDAQVGRFVESLKRRGLYDDALIVFTADHGEALGERGVTGHKDTLYDEVLHVPLIVKLPAGHPDAGRLASASKRLVRGIDLTPTLLELLRLPPLPGQGGSSLIGNAPVRPLLAETHPPIAKRELFCLRDASRKLIYAPATDSFELYELESDPDEEHDVFAQRGARLVDWQRELRRIAAAASTSGTADPIIDHEAAQRIKGLGY